MTDPQRQEIQKLVVNFCMAANSVSKPLNGLEILEVYSALENSEVLIPTLAIIDGMQQYINQSPVVLDDIIINHRMGYY